MTQYLECFYKEQPMGVMSWNPERTEGWFEFQPSFWQTDIQFSPIQFPNEVRGMKAPVLSFGGKNEATNYIPPFLQDALPGKYARTLLEYALRPSGKSTQSLSPLAWCSLLGKRGMGAIRFEPSGYPELDTIEPVDIARLVRHAHQLNLSNQDSHPTSKELANSTGKRLSDNRLRELLRSGLFTTTETPAALLSVNDFTGEVLSGQASVPQGFEAWIIKLDGITPQPPTDLREWFTHHKKALACDLSVLPCRLMHEGQQTHLLSKRLDRDENGAVHVQSYTALREKSGPEVANSCEGLFRCLRLLRLPYTEQEEWYKRIVFNGMVSNRQERASDVFFEYKNDSIWHLAPYNGFPPAQSENMTMGGKMSDWTLDDYRFLGKQQHIRRYESLIQACQSALAVFT